ncbi:MAG: type II toxin-antitoxin system RelE/ParE family toxin [Bacteroidota bacterium]
MIKRFEVVFMREAEDFLMNLSASVSEKITYNIEKSIYKNDATLFKKIQNGIWEFRTIHLGMRYRLLSFWDFNKSNSAVVIKHGCIKKTSKLPKQQIEKAIKRRSQYYRQSL